MRKHLRSLPAVAILILLALVAAVPAMAQDEVPPPAAAPSPTPGPALIPVSEIPTRAASVHDLVRNINADITADERLAEIRQSLPTETTRIVEVANQTDEALQQSGGASQFKELEKASIRSQERLARWMEDLSDRSSHLESTLKDLQDRRSLWELTRDAEREDALPDAVMEQLAEAIEAIRSGESAVRTARDDVLDLQAKIAQQQSVVNQMLAQQRDEIAKRSVGIFETDSPSLWRAWTSAGDEEIDIDGRFTTLLRRQFRDVHGYVAERGAVLLNWIVLWVGLSVVLILMHRRARLWVQQDRSLSDTVSILERPIAAAAILVGVLINITDERAPAAWFDAVNLIVLLAFVLVLLSALDKPLRPLPYLLIPLYLLFMMVEIAPVGSLVQRLLLIALTLAGIGFCLWFVRALRETDDDLSETWEQAVTRGLSVGVFLFAIGLVANVFGNVRLGTLFVKGTTDAILTGLILWAVGGFLRSLVRILLITPAARKIGIAPDHSEEVRHSSSWMINLIITVLWVIFTLRAFFLYDDFLAAGSRALEATISIAGLSVRPGYILVFAFVIWLSIKFAALVEFILEVIVLPHVELPIGVPETISRLTRYGIILVGVVMAFTAIGFDISKAALVAGGLGVGVGFGLQNIVNNFVSGLILLFERPIRVGDIIELGTTSGKVEKIGMRATLIRTWTGARVDRSQRDPGLLGCHQLDPDEDRQASSDLGRRRLRQ